MAEIDPVILELRAELGKYRADLKSTTSQVQRLLGNQEKSVQRLEKQMRRSSTAISGALRTIGASLGTYISGREVVGLIDNFIRLQNALKVAGLEGAGLERVQSSLLDLSSRYGVSVGELANLYGKSAQAASDLGASEAQLLQITEASAQALKITGTSAVQAQGALLGLTQALSSGIVRAEEFNQINEGGLRPLLQVAANAEKYGGSVAKLRMAVVDGKVSSQEFYQAILAGSDELEGKASKATLTLAGAFEALTSRLTVYVGQSAEANGVTQALAGAMQLLAENLDKIIPALAIIATVLGGRFLAGALAGGAALRTLAAYASIATTSLAGTALAARGAGAALLAAFGGPVGLAITALVLGIGYLVAETRAATDAAKEAELQAIRTASAQETEKKATDLLAAAKGAEKTAQIEATKASRDRAAQALQTAKALQAEAKAALVAARAQARKIYEDSAGDTGFLATLGRGLGGAGGAGPTITPGTGKANRIDMVANSAQAKLDESNRKIAALEGEVDGLTAAIGDGAKAPGLAATGTAADKKTKKRGGGGASGRSPAEIEERFNQELISIGQQTLSARQSMATSAEERADLETRNVELAHRAALNSLAADDDYNAAQKARVKEALDKLAIEERARIAQTLRIQTEEDRLALAETEHRAQSDVLRDQYELATTLDQRRAIALQILEAEDAFLRSKLQAVRDNDDLSAAIRQQADIELNALNASAGDRRRLVERSNQGPLDRYIEDTRDTKTRVEEAMVRELQSVNDGITDALTKQLGIKNQFVKDLFSIFLDDVIFRPLAEALRNRQSGGGGLFGAILSGIGAVFGGGSSLPGTAGGMDLRGFGRASGGYVAPGQTVRVNEHRGGAEYLRMGSQGGHVIPLGQVNARAAQPAAQGGGVTVVRLTLSGDIDARIDQRAAAVSVEVVRESAGPISDMGAQKALGALNRPSL